MRRTGTTGIIIINKYLMVLEQRKEGERSIMLIAQSR